MGLEEEEAVVAVSQVRVVRRVPQVDQDPDRKVRTAVLVIGKEQMQSMPLLGPAVEVLWQQGLLLLIAWLVMAVMDTSCLSPLSCRHGSRVGEQVQQHNTPIAPAAPHSA